MPFRPPYKNEDGSLATVDDLRQSRPWLFTDETKSQSDRVYQEKMRWLHKRTKKFSEVAVNYEFRFADGVFNECGTPSIFMKVRDDNGKEFAVSRFGQVKYPNPSDLVYR